MAMPLKMSARKAIHANCCQSSCWLVRNGRATFILAYLFGANKEKCRFPQSHPCFIKTDVYLLFVCHIIPKQY